MHNNFDYQANRMHPSPQTQPRHSNIKPVAHYCPKEPLKDRYAHRILQLEYRIETLSNGQDCLPQLMKLYTRAIQFHQGVGSSHFRLYQRRMEGFLQRPCVDQILRGTVSQFANHKEETIKNIQIARIQSKLAVSKLIENSEKQMDRINYIANRSMKKQQQSLESRLKRRRTLSNRSTVSSRGQLWEERNGELPLLKALQEKLAEIEAEHQTDSYDK